MPQAAARPQSKPAAKPEPTPAPAEKGTKYVVLVVDPDGRYRHCGTQTAANDVTAIKQQHATGDFDADKEWEFIATPERSFNKRKVTTKTVTRTLID